MTAICPCRRARAAGPVSRPVLRGACQRPAAADWDKEKDPVKIRHLHPAWPAPNRAFNGIAPECRIIR